MLEGHAEHLRGALVHDARVVDQEVEAALAHGLAYLLDHAGEAGVVCHVCGREGERVGGRGRGKGGRKGKRRGHKEEKGGRSGRGGIIGSGMGKVGEMGRVRDGKGRGEGETRGHRFGEGKGGQVRKKL